MRASETATPSRVISRTPRLTWLGLSTTISYRVSPRRTVARNPGQLAGMQGSTTRSARSRPPRRNGRLQAEAAAVEPDAEDRFQAGALHPSRRARVHRPSAAAGLGWV